MFQSAFVFFFWNISVWKVGSLNGDYLHKLGMHPYIISTLIQLLELAKSLQFYKQCGIVKKAHIGFS